MLYFKQKHYFETRKAALKIHNEMSDLFTALINLINILKLCFHKGVHGWKKYKKSVHL